MKSTTPIRRKSSFAGTYRPQVTTTLWEEEKTLCYQVEVKGIYVARREDNDFINGTKLLNVAKMTRGRRDGILKSEATRHVVKSGSKNLKGIWISFERALYFAEKENIATMLYPLFLEDIKKYLYDPMSRIRSSSASLEAHPNNIYSNSCQTPTEKSTEQDTHTIKNNPEFKPKIGNKDFFSALDICPRPQISLENMSGMISESIQSKPTAQVPPRILSENLSLFQSNTSMNSNNEFRGFFINQQDPKYSNIQNLSKPVENLTPVPTILPANNFNELSLTHGNSSNFQVQELLDKDIYFYTKGEIIETNLNNLPCSGNLSYVDSSSNMINNIQRISQIPFNDKQTFEGYPPNNTSNNTH